MDIAGDVLVQIFALLSLNTICQLRCVCKSWNIIITSRILQEFWKCATLPPLLPQYLLRAEDGYLSYNLVRQQWKILPFSFLFPDDVPLQDMKIVASAGGVILLEHHPSCCSSALMLFNPVTKSRRTLQPISQKSFNPLYALSVQDKHPSVFAFNRFHSEGDGSETMGTYDLKHDVWVMEEIRSGSPSKKHECRDILFCDGFIYSRVATLVDGDGWNLRRTEHYLFQLHKDGWQIVFTENGMPKVMCGSLFEHDGTVRMVGGYFHSLFDFRICIWKLDMQLSWVEEAALPESILSKVFQIRMVHCLVFRVIGDYIFIGLAHSKSRMVMYNILESSWMLMPPIPALYADFVLRSVGTSAHDRFLFEPSLS